MRLLRVAPTVLAMLLVPIVRGVGQINIAQAGFVSSPKTRVPAADLARVIGVVSDSRGTVYVLDQRRRQIVVFDSAGSFKYAAGRGGRGSDPFGVPASLKVGQGSSKDHLFVWDMGARRLTEYLAMPDSLRHLRDIRSGVNASDACVLGSRIFVFGLEGGKVVHELDTNGGVKSSFGDPIGPDYPGAQRRLSWGQIVCDRQNDQILISAQQVPIVRAYSPSGELRWTAKLANFLAVQVTPSGDGALIYRAPSDSGTDIVVSTIVAGERVLVQAGRLSSAAKTPDDFSGISTHILNATNGVEETTATSIPWILSVDSQRAFSVTGADRPEIHGARLLFTARRK